MLRTAQRSRSAFVYWPFEPPFKRVSAMRRNGKEAKAAAGTCAAALCVPVYVRIYVRCAIEIIEIHLLPPKKIGGNVVAQRMLQRVGPMRLDIIAKK